MNARHAKPGNLTEVIHFRSRRARAPREATVLTLNLAPMIDVVFLLLIFFISTTTLERAEGVLPSRLPRHSGLTGRIAPPITPIVIHVRQTGPGLTDYSLRVESFANTPTTFNELASFLTDVQANPGFDDETPVVIQASPDVLWDHVVGCWNAAVRAGCKCISFGLQ